MATTDSNGIVFLEETDPISPFHTTINTLQQATSDVVEAINTDITDLTADVAAVAPSTFTNVPYYDASWEVYDATPSFRPKYFKANGLVFLTSGRITRASTSLAISATADTPFLKIPEGFRPEQAPAEGQVAGMGAIYYGTGAVVPAKVAVQTNGDVTVRPVTAGTLVNGVAHFIEVPPLFWIPQA